MAIRVAIRDETQLNIASPLNAIDKLENYTVARLIGGVSQIGGHWQGMAVRWPTVGMGTTGIFPLVGRTNAVNPGSAPSARDTALRFYSTNSGTTARQQRYSYISRDNTAIGFDVDGEAISQVPLGEDHVVLWGVNYVSSVAQWRAWVATAILTGPNAGTIETFVEQTQPTTAWLTATTNVPRLIVNIFEARGNTPNDQTPVDTIFEHACFVRGNFPWDTANNPTGGQTGVGRPHHDAIRDLCGFAGATLRDYGQLVQAQNAGTTGYANLDAGGRGNLDHWWTLENLTDGLVNRSFTGETIALSINQLPTSNGLVDNARISPAHWRYAPTAALPPVITEPRLKFFGGRGTLPVTISGTNANNVERRWVFAGTNTTVPGFDWAVRTVTSSAWSTADVLPVGNYDLQVRDTVDNLLVSTLTDILVGTKLLFHGQSGMALSFWSSGNITANQLNIAMASDANGVGMQMVPDSAQTGSSYTQPVPTYRRATAGTTPAISSYVCNFINQWNTFQPGHPVCVQVMAISGTSMTNWTADAFVDTSAGWRFLGNTTPTPPGPSAPDGSGVVSYWAWLNSGQIDGHVMMWSPNMGGDATAWNGYIAAIDARFANSTNAPWLMIPPWRSYIDPTGGEPMNRRQWHEGMMEVLGERGFLGPHWADVVSDGNNGRHPAVMGAAISDTNRIGAARTTSGMARAAARMFNQEVNASFRLLNCWTDNACVTVNCELGRKGRTLNGAAIALGGFQFSLDGGSTWTTGAPGNMAAAFDATNTRVVITPASPATWETARGNGLLRIDYARDNIFPPAGGPATGESANITPLEGMIYDAGTWRGRTDLATPAGNVLQGTNIISGTGAGVTVTLKGNPRLVTQERMSGPRTVTVRMRRVSDNTLAAERTFVISTSDPFDEPLPPDPDPPIDPPPDPDPPSSGQFEYDGITVNVTAL